MRKKGKIYSKGKLNKIIDAIVHPLYQKNEGFRFLDGLAHALVEQDPKTSVKKFVKYNVPELIKKALKKE